MFLKKSITLFILMISLAQVILSAPYNGLLADTGAGEISPMSKRQTQDISDGAGNIHYNHPPSKRQIQERGDGYGKGTLHLNPHDKRQILNLSGGRGTRTAHPHGKRQVQDISDGYGTIHYNGPPGKHKVPDVYGKGQAHAHGKRKIPDGYGNGSLHAHGMTQARRRERKAVSPRYEQVNHI